MLARIAIATALAATTMATNSQCNAYPEPKETTHTSGKVVAHTQTSNSPKFTITFQPDDGTAPQTKVVDAAGFLHCPVGRRWPKCNATQVM